MAYIVILIILAILFVFRFISGHILKEDKSQILIFFVYLIYALITVNHRLRDGSIYSADAFNLFSYFLLTATYILIGEYICYIYPNKIYRYISLLLYGGIVSSMINQYILCFHSDIRYIYHICLVYLSIIYICFSMFFWIKDFRKMDFDKKMLMLAANVMILSFTVLEIFNLKHIPYAAFCAIGLFIYILCAEYVAIKKIKQRLYDMESIKAEMQVIKQSRNMDSQETVQNNENNKTVLSNMNIQVHGTVEKVFQIMLSDQKATAKDIAMQLDISHYTVKSYQNQIYSQLRVHNREDFNKLLNQNSYNE